MTEGCEILLDKQVYRPGDKMNGKIICGFLIDTTIRDILIRFKGKTKVSWKEGRNNTPLAEEVYFDTEYSLLEEEHTFRPGTYTYPFDFQLPNQLPSSMYEYEGSVTYSIRGIMLGLGSYDTDTKKIIQVHTYHDLNSMEHLLVPCEKRAQNKSYLHFLNEPDPISFCVRLPATGFVPSQMIRFYASIKNDSNFAVEVIRFKIIQGFSFHTQTACKRRDTFVGQEFEIVDSDVGPGCHKEWHDLEIRVPVIFNHCLDHCNLIKVYWEFKGEVVLPFGHKNIIIRIPLTLGAAPAIQLYK